MNTLNRSSLYARSPVQGLPGLGPGLDPLQGGFPNGAMSPDMIVQLQQLLLSVLAPMLQNVLGASSGFSGLPGAPSAPGAPGAGGSGYGAPGSNAVNPAYGGRPQNSPAGGVVPGRSFGGVDGFFRDVGQGLTQGAFSPGRGSGPHDGGGYAPTGGGYAPTGPGYGAAGGADSPGTNGGSRPTPGTYAPGNNGPQYGSGAPAGGAPTVDSNGNPVGETIDANLDYRQLTTEQRRAVSGMSDRERAVLHLWGIQMTSKGSQDGGVLLNVLNDPHKFQPAEVALAQELVARDRAQYGGVTGKSLDAEFFNLYQGITGKDISGRYAGAPIQYAQGPVDMDKRLTGDNGLSSFENQVLQLWGHSPLFNQGQIDGNIVEYALRSSNTLEANLNRSDLEALRAADLASDGVLNGDSLENAFIDTLDRLYLGGPGATVDKTMNDALEEAALRRQGLLPPPKPGSGYEIQPEAISPDQSRLTGGGQCPFLAGGGTL